MSETQSGGTFFEKYGVAIALLAGLIIIAGAIAFGRPGNLPTGDGTGTAAVVNIQDVRTDTSPVVGSATAPVTVAVWFDYQCPFCKRFDLDALAQVYSEYVVPGKVRIVYKDFQFLGPDSDTAGVYARAVWEAYPDRFYEWFTAMMNAQDEEHGGFGDRASIDTLTKGLGMDTARIASLITANQSAYQAAMAADRDEGASFGINGTPGTIIGTTLVPGAESYTRVKSLIDAELAK